MHTPPEQDPDLPVSEIMRAWPCTIGVFIRYRMLCVGCAAAPFHSISEACAEHAVDEQEFRDAVDAALRNAPAPA